MSAVTSRASRTQQLAGSKGINWQSVLHWNGGDFTRGKMDAVDIEIGALNEYIDM